MKQTFGMFLNYAQYKLTYQPQSLSLHIPKEQANRTHPSQKKKNQNTNLINLMYSHRL